jgi:HK97 family phage portal protein
MLKWLNRFLRKDYTPYERQILLRGGETGFFDDRNYLSLAENGYRANIVANHCINQIAKACADIPLIISVNGQDIEEDDDNDQPPVIDLLSKPNYKQSYCAFMFEAIAYRLISGNTYFHLVKGDITNTPFEIELFRPDRVYIEATSENIPYQYLYSIAGKQYVYPIDQETGVSECLHIKTFNPNNDLYGMSPITAARLAIGQHNDSSVWNSSLLQNSAKPSGYLTIADKNDNAPPMTPEQVNDVRKQTSMLYSGPRNAGKIPVFNYDLKWQSMSFSPVDMDWLNGRNATAREICLAFGFPSFLLPVPDATSTYNNVESAKLALYEETVIPTLNAILEPLGQWLGQQTGIDLELEPDLDQVTALLPRREIARQNARADFVAGILTLNEARAEIDYEPVDGGDQVMVPAGKLPLNFDVTGLDAQKFQEYLVQSGVPASDAKELAEIAYKDN